MRDQGCGRRRFTDDGHAGEKRGGRLFRQTPSRKVECINVHGNSSARQADVLRGKSRRAANLLRISIDDYLCVAKLRADVGIGSKGEARSVNVELRVPPRVAAVSARDLDELLAALVQHPREALEHLRALLEAHRAQRGTALLLGVRQDRSEIDAATGDLINLEENLTSAKADLLATIRREKKLSDELTAELKSAIESWKAGYAS